MGVLELAADEWAECTCDVVGGDTACDCFDGCLGKHCARAGLMIGP